MSKKQPPARTNPKREQRIRETQQKREARLRTQRRRQRARLAIIAGAILLIGLVAFFAVTFFAHAATRPTYIGALPPATPHITWQIVIEQPINGIQYVSITGAMLQAFRQRDPWADEQHHPALASTGITSTPLYRPRELSRHHDRVASRADLALAA